MSSTTLPVCPKTGSTSPASQSIFAYTLLRGNRECARQKRPPRWTADELALLDAILTRSPDGCETGRFREVLEIAEAIGRSQSATINKLYLRRKAQRLAV